MTVCSTKRVTYSRGYVNFCEAKGAVEFKSKFDGFVFVGARGTQYKCVIEYAPYQRVPKQKGKMDRRQGTIEQGTAFAIEFEGCDGDVDPDYIEFVEKLDKAPVMLPSAQRQYEEEQQLRQETGEGDDEIVMTPLMECIVNKHLNKITSRSSVRSIVLKWNGRCVALGKGEKGGTCQRAERRQNIKTKDFDTRQVDTKSPTQAKTVFWRIRFCRKAFKEKQSSLLSGLLC